MGTTISVASGSKVDFPSTVMKHAVGGVATERHGVERAQDGPSGGRRFVVTQELAVTLAQPAAAWALANLAVDVAIVGRGNQQSLSARRAVRSPCPSGAQQHRGQVWSVPPEGERATRSRECQLL